VVDISRQIDGSRVVKSTPLSYIRISRSGQWGTLLCIFHENSFASGSPTKFGVRRLRVAQLFAKIEEKVAEIGTGKVLNGVMLVRMELRPDLDPQDPPSFRIERKPGRQHAAFQHRRRRRSMLVKARKILLAAGSQDQIVGLLPQSPLESSEPVEESLSFPMGAARLA